MYGLGMGPTWRSGPATIDVDAIAWQVNHGTWHDDRISLLAQLRTTVAWPLLGVAAVGGVAVNTYIRDEQTKMNQEVGVRIWPSAFAGVRF